MADFFVFVLDIFLLKVYDKTKQILCFDMI